MRLPSVSYWPPWHGTAEAGDRDRRDQRHVGELLRAARVERPVRLHRAAEVRAVVRDDREARLAVQLPVVAHVGRAPRDDAFLRVEHEGRDDVLPLREVGDRPDVVVLDALLEERREHHEADRRCAQQSTEDAAEPERRELEELRARVAVRQDTLRRRPARPVRRRQRPRLQLRSLPEPRVRARDPTRSSGRGSRGMRTRARRAAPGPRCTTR